MHLDGYNQMDMITGKGLRTGTKSGISESELVPCVSMTTSIVSSTSLEGLGEVIKPKLDVPDLFTFCLYSFPSAR